jgi:hypothetical protein
MREEARAIEHLKKEELRAETVVQEAQVCGMSLPAHLCILAFACMEEVG